MSHLKNKVARRTARLTSVLLAMLMILTVAPIIAFPASADEGSTTTPYRIVHLDCGRKYFSVENIKKLIDTMAQYGYNQLQLAFGNGGCRFLLDDMSLEFDSVKMTSDTVKTNITNGNNSFNGDTRYLKQTDMDEIITYANDKGIEIVPMLNMPGHAKAIVHGTNYSDNDNLNVNNEVARNYGYALLTKYVDYFKGKGCKFFHFGSDESGYTGDNMTAFLKGCADVITNAGMTPRAFNDATNVATMPTSVQITYWHQESGSKTASALSNAGYEMINTHGRWYYVIKTTQGSSEEGTKYWNGNLNGTAVSVELPTLKAEKMDNKWVGINEYFDGNPGYGSTISGSLGSMFCIWCDASQDKYLTDSDVISENENYGALYQIEKLAEHYWPDDIKKEETTKPTVTVDDGTAVPSQITNGKTLTLKSNKSVTWTTSNSSVIDLLNPANSETITGTTVTLVTKGTGTATITATDSSGNAVSYTITVNASISGSDTVKNVFLNVGESTTITVADGIEAKSYITGKDSYIATAEVKHTEGVAETTVSTTKSTELEAGASYILRVHNTIYALTSNTGKTDWGTKTLAFESYTAAEDDNVWTLEASGTGYKLKCVAGYLNLGTAVNTAYVDNTGEVFTLTYTDNGWFLLSPNGFYLDALGGVTNYYSAGGWTSLGTYFDLYKVTTATPESNTLTITGTGEGDTEVTIGNVTYKISVTAETVTKDITLTHDTSFTLPTGAEITFSEEKYVTIAGGKVTAGSTNGTEVVEAVVKNGGKYVTARYIYNITVTDINFDDIDDLPVQLWITNTWVGATGVPDSVQTVNIVAKDVYSEAGVLLSELVPPTGYKKDGASSVRVTYWKGVILSDGKEPVQQGDDYSNSGVDFIRVRYWNKAWQYLKGFEWVTIDTSAGKDTVIAYYLQINKVADEITTGSQHYGNPPTSDPGNSTYGFTLTAFAVVYPDGTLSRTEAEMYKTGMIRGFYGKTSFDLGAIYAENNSTYKISKMTVTWGKHVKGYGSSISWTNMTGTYGTDWGVVWNKKTNSAGDEWYDETTYWKSGDSDIPTINDPTLKFEYGETNAVLILIYLEVVETDNTLNIVYWDDNANKQITTNPMPIPIVVKPNGTFLDIVQTSTVTKGTFTLDDGAYIVNSSGGKQSFNKNLSTVPGVTGVYLSGMYKYVSAYISEDGMTLTLHFNLKSASGDKNYVIDFGLPLVINPSDFGITNIKSIEWVSLQAGDVTTSRRGEYGTATIADDWSKVTYVLDSILTAKATIPLYVKYTGNDTVYLYQANVYPASTVYYEEDFIKYETEEDATGTENDVWKKVGEVSGTQVTEVLGDQKNPYGYDGAYVGNNNFSMGSYRWVEVNNSRKTATAHFTFTGTGFDLISATGKDTGAIFIDILNNDTGDVTKLFVDTYYGYVYGVDETNPWLKCVWTYTYDSDGKNGKWHVTRKPVKAKDGESGEFPATPTAGQEVTTYEPNYTWSVTKDDSTLYQIPVISVTDLDHGSYTVTITARYNKFFDHANKEAFKVCIDGVRIYNTLADSSVYAPDAENDHDFTEVRDIIISADDFGKNGTDAGAVFIDGFEKEGTVDDFKKFGPNNEVYLANGQGIAFNISIPTGARIFIGAKSPNGSAKLYVNNQEVSVNNEKVTVISTATDMYYDITGLINKDGTNVISNKGDGILSITTIKVTNGKATFTVSAQTISEARAMLLSMIQPEVPVFTPERFEASWSTVTLFRNSVHALMVRTSTDVDHITVDGKEITNFYYAAAFEGWGRNRKLVKYKVFTLFLGNDANIGDYEVVAFDADGVASEAHIATLTGKTGVGKFN